MLPIATENPIVNGVKRVDRRVLAKALPASCMMRIDKCDQGATLRVSSIGSSQELGSTKMSMNPLASASPDDCWQCRSSALGSRSLIVRYNIPPTPTPKRKPTKGSDKILKENHPTMAELSSAKPIRPRQPRMRQASLRLCPPPSLLMISPILSDSARLSMMIARAISKARPGLITAPTPMLKTFDQLLSAGTARYYSHFAATGLASRIELLDMRALFSSASLPAS
jgi:hypothetical protein